MPNLSGDIDGDGSSTVYPITEAVAEEFGKKYSGVRVTAGIAGTGGGFEKFCNGETDFNDASRPIKDTEAQACARQRHRVHRVPGRLRWPCRRDEPVQRLRRLPDRRRAEEDLGACGTRGPITNWNQVRDGFPDKAPLASTAPARTPGRSTSSRRRSTASRTTAVATTRRAKTTTRSSRAWPATKVASATSASPTMKRTPTS